MSASSGVPPRASILIVCHRRSDLLADCLRSIRENVQGVAAETIVLFNGTPEAERFELAALLDGTRVVVSGVNLGFGAGNNRAAEFARGEFLVFLNDDAEVRPGWLEALVATADRHPRAGAVGSKVVLPDGRLQEAGSIIWSDGSTLGVGRGIPEASRQWDYRRETDYASACSLLVRRALFEQIGGFDDRFFPGYNEDVDLCLSIRASGHRVLYEPRSEIVHHESQTGADAKTFLIMRGRKMLNEKWGPALERFPEPHPRDPTAIALAVHRAKGSPRRVLIVDDRLPNPGLGSGFGRMLDALRDLSGAGYATYFYPTASGAGEVSELQELGVEVIEQELGKHLADPANFYDVAIVSRPHNFKHVRRLRRFQPHAAVIYDAEALFHRRLEREAELLAASDPAAAELTLRKAEDARRLERRVVRAVDRVISVSKVEARFLRSIPRHCPVDVIEPLAPDVRMTRRAFSERDGMVFVAGWLGPYPSPNSDGLEWFAAHALPLIEERLGSVRLSITGGDPPREVQELAGESIRFVGHVKDLAQMYDAARLAIVPVRYGAGIKIKALEALQHGVPVVTTSVGAEGIDGAGGPAVSVCDDPGEFAEHALALLRDERTWDTARTAITALHERWESRVQAPWAAIVETALQEKTIDRVALHR